MPRNIALRRSPIHGNGVFAVADIAAATTLAEYRGRRLTIAEADDIYGDTLETGHTFLFTLNDEYVVDANLDGNIARWINHSCEPNCEPLLVEDADGDGRARQGGDRRHARDPAGRGTDLRLRHHARRAAHGEA